MDFLNSRFVSIEGWDYELKNEDGSRLLIWHHVTPEDGGYGTKVRFYITCDYFKNHTVQDLYNEICSKHLSPICIDRASEIKALNDALVSLGFLA